MSEVSIKKFANQIGVSTEKLIEQLKLAGIVDKSLSDRLNDEEKVKLLQYLQTGNIVSAPGSQKITLNCKTTNEIRQTSKTGAARTVHVEVKKRRTFIKKSVLVAEQLAQKEAEKKEAEEKELKKQQQIETEKHDAIIKKARDEANLKKNIEEKERTKLEQIEKERDAQELAIQQAKKQPTEQAINKNHKIAAKTDKSTDKLKGKSKGKGKGKGKIQENKREELHVSRKRRHTNRRRKPQRKSGKISSSTAEQHAFAKPTEPMVHDVKVPETITVGELAQAMSIKAAEVIKVMMQLGSMATINQVLDQNTAILIVEEMDHKAVAVKLDDPEDSLIKTEASSGKQVSRPPVVTVMGHVDHGKTSLLDYLRKTKVAAGESGGITQHIGAYRIETGKGSICFLDTPGHEAFSAMRARGAKATDIVILVVAADDGVKPQTIEAINHAQVAEVPIIVAINKIDKENADPDRIKQDLSKHNIIPEDWGGDVLITEISAITGHGIDSLLESVLLQSELLDLKTEVGSSARGIVIEARLDKGRGPVSTVLVQHGEICKGDILLVGRETGRVRVLLDDVGNPINKAGPSMPVEIQGLAGVPIAGDDVIVVGDERKAREIALHRQGMHKEIQLAQQHKVKFDSMFAKMGDRKAEILNLVIKADVQGSVEALTEALEKLSGDEVTAKVVHGMVGGINESDISLAMASNAVILAFNVRADSLARKMIEREGVDVRYYNVIYNIIDDVKAAMSGMLSPDVRENIVGLAQVRDVFKAPKIGAIAGSYVVEGVLRRNLPARVLRDNIVIFEGAIDSLRRFKEDTGEVKNGYECGIGIKNYNDIKVGDQIEVFEIIETRKQL